VRTVPAADACKVVSMGRKVDVDDLIDTQDVARILGLAHRNTVSEYQARYADMPRPVVDLGRGRSKLWLRHEVQSWADKRSAAISARRRSSP
jgi:predicted DNA-binding transcriptional regulator AlpA